MTAKRERPYWGLAITFMDEENNQFLCLGGAAWETKRERDVAFASIPKAVADSPFIVDVEDDNGTTDDRVIDWTIAERLLGKSISMAVSEARKLESENVRRVSR
jgi:hypothetical protein